MISRIIDRWRAKAQTAALAPSSPTDSADRFHHHLRILGDVILRHRWTPLITVIIVFLLNFVLQQIVFPRHDPLEVAARACASPGEWFDLETADPIDQSQLIHDVADRPMVLLGKTDTANLDEGRWLGFTVAALYGVRRDIVIALDSFPASQQVLLDRWVHGEIDEAELLRTLEWRSAYTPDAETYIPLLRLARLYHVPLLAIGIDATMAEHLERENWASIPASARHRDRPAEPPEGYRRSLAALHLAARLSEDGDRTSTEPSRLIFSEELAPILVSDHFRRFMRARRAEDWLLAHKLVAARHRPGRPLVIGVIGRSHLEYGWGVPSQLAALGTKDPAILLPFTDSRDCVLIRPGVADAVFILEPGTIASVPAPLPVPEPVIDRIGDSAP